MVRATNLLERYAEVLEQVGSYAKQSGRSPESVTLLAVSKFQAVSDMLTINAKGQKLFGENYVQEALVKHDVLTKQATKPWALHLIGHLQSRKVAQIIGAFALLQSLDSRKLAHALEKRLAKLEQKQAVLLEVNLGDEEQKTGLPIAEIPAFADYVQEECPHLELQGLMGMPPYFADGSCAQPYFARLRELAEQLRQKTGLALPELSMGMSGDFPWAILEGATIVRLGTAIFGPRHKP